MDFHSMKRKELQALCKKHSLPANKTNLQMAQTLASLLIKEAVEKPVKNLSEKAGSNDSNIETRRPKKVKFCLEEEKTEISDSKKNDSDRIVPKSILKPQLQIPKLVNVEKMGNSQNLEEETDVPVRVTRARARKSMGTELSMLDSPPVKKKKKGRIDNNSTRNICRIDKEIDETINVEVGNAAPMTISLRRREIDVCPKRKEVCFTETRKESNGNLRDGGEEEEETVPMIRSLRSRKIDVYSEKKDKRNARKTRKGGSEDWKKEGPEIGDIGILMAEKSMNKRSKKMENGNAVAKRNLRSNGFKERVILEEETENGSKTEEAMKSYGNLVQSADKIETVAGDEIQDKNESLVQLEETMRHTSPGKKSSVLVSNGDDVVKVGGKNRSKLVQACRRSQRRVGRSKSFAPETETASKTRAQVQEENDQALQTEDPKSYNATRQESAVLVTKDETVVQSERKMISKFKDPPRRSWRKTHESKSFHLNHKLEEIVDDSSGQNKLGEQLETGPLEEEISLPEAGAVDDVEDTRHEVSEDIAGDEENSRKVHFNYGEVILMEEKESAVTMVENLSFKITDQDKEKKQLADDLVEKFVNEDGGEAASMILKESLELPETSEISEDHDTCDTTLLRSQDYIPNNLEYRANMETIEGNLASENDTSLVHFKDDRLLVDKDVIDTVFSCERGGTIDWDKGKARTSQNFVLMEADDHEVQSEKGILNFEEPAKQEVLLEEAGEVVTEVMSCAAMPIQQSNSSESRKYREDPVSQRHVEIDPCCVADREVEDYKGFTCEGDFVEHEEVDRFLNSPCEPVFDHMEACEEGGDSNGICGVVQCDGNMNTKTNDETIEICQVDSEANERTGNVLDNYDNEHQVSLQVIGNETIVEGEEIIIEDKLKQEKEDADASGEELGTESGGETGSVMAKESESHGTCDISEDTSIFGSAILVSQVHYTSNVENGTNAATILENCVCEDKKCLAEEGKDPDSFQQVVSEVLVDLKNVAQLELGHANSVFGELILEENRSLEDKTAIEEIFDCKGGKRVADGEDNVMISPQNELVEPFDHGNISHKAIQKCIERVQELALKEASEVISDTVTFHGLIPIEQYNPLDDGRNNEISVNHQPFLTHSFSKVEDYNKGFNYKGDLAECEDSDGSAIALDEPGFDHLELRTKNEISHEVCDVLERDGNGICKNAPGERDIKDPECTEETNAICQAIPEANIASSMDMAEKYLETTVVQEEEKSIEDAMGEHTATVNEEYVHKDSELLNEKESEERSVSKLENRLEVLQKLEESSEPTLTEYEDPEDEGKNENKAKYDHEYDRSEKEITTLQETHEIVQAGQLTINDTGHHSPVEMLASPHEFKFSGSARRNPEDQSPLISTASILCSRKSQEVVVRETVVSKMEDVEEAPDATVATQSVNRNFEWTDFSENIQVMGKSEFESLSKFSEVKGKDHFVEEHVDAVEQNSASKSTEWTIKDKLAAKTSGVTKEIQANVEAFLINFGGDDDEQAISMMPENVGIGNAIEDVDAHGNNILESKTREDVEEASDGTLATHSINMNFERVDLSENVQLVEKVELESSSKFSEVEGTDDAIEENDGAIEQYSKSKCTEQTMGDKLEAKTSGAIKEVEANAEVFSINFWGDNDEHETSMAPKKCLGYFGTGKMLDTQGVDIQETRSAFMSHGNSLFDKNFSSPFSPYTLINVDETESTPHTEGNHACKPIKGSVELGENIVVSPLVASEKRPDHQDDDVSEAHHQVNANLDEHVMENDEHSQKAATIGAKLDCKVIEAMAIAAEGNANANASLQVSPLKLVHHEDYNGKVATDISVSATSRELATEHNKITENNSNEQMVEGSFVYMDLKSAVLEEETSSDASDNLGNNQVLTKVEGSCTVTDELGCGHNDASENLGCDREENVLGASEDHIMEQVSCMNINCEYDEPVFGDNHATDDLGCDEENVDDTLQVFPENLGTNEHHTMEQVSGLKIFEDVVLDDYAYDHSSAERKRETDVKDSVTSENFSVFSLKNIFTSGSSVNTSLRQDEKDASKFCNGNRPQKQILEDNCKSTSGRRNSSFSSIDIADKGNDLELKGCNGDAEFPLLPDDQAEDGEGGNNNVGMTNSTDQEIFAVEKAGEYKPMRDSAEKKEIKEANMVENNSTLTKMRISSALKGRGFRPSMTPIAPKKSFEELKQSMGAFDMKENVMNMKNEESGNCFVVQSGMKRRALEDLRKSGKRDP